MNTKDIKVDFSDLRKTIGEIERRFNSEIELKKKLQKDMALFREKVQKYKYDVEFVFIPIVKNDSKKS